MYNYGGWLWTFIYSWIYLSRGGGGRRNFCSLEEGSLFSAYADNWTTIDWIPVCVDDYYFEWEIIGRERISMNFCYMKFNWIVCLGRWIMVWYLLICGDWIVFSKIFFLWLAVTGYVNGITVGNFCFFLETLRYWLNMWKQWNCSLLFFFFFIYSINIFIGIIEL